ncbi:polysaccharide deacetylase family protein [Paenisporosarcina quisquiliarum]|uniref:Polysaccharide deacetylase family protein n=1 Tax=Paenisporosarcina quisquiliarum TaxID=365346 RepID=A0A9X3LGD4_9BACL|nr:polysaccharide deacetylase family protein [Paenisporosarcina quisquiliarum]MCZ8537463.1 polysaccharide deacetylase family protein [Paenisporosarcina quisquiliarum]
MTNSGALIVSLDFELNWGVHDVFSLEQYGAQLLGARKAIPRMLDLFKQYDVHATWGVVGLLCFVTKQEMLEHLPEIKPSYLNSHFSPYEKLDMVGDDESMDPYHFGASFLRGIAETPHQEIGSHTFSHFYCLEEGQTSEQFEADLIACKNILEMRHVDMKSFIFPRNQTDHHYLEICKKHGVISYRGNEKNWVYEACNYGQQHPLKRATRLVDHYINLTGHHTYKLEKSRQDPIINLPASRFLRPYSNKMKMLESFRLNRIKNSLTYAAKKGEIYHLWWHPHNFGLNLDENMRFLESIFEHVEILKKRYSFVSLNMKEAAQKIQLEHL